MLKPARPSPADREARQRQPSHSPSTTKLAPPRSKPRPTESKGKPPMDAALVRSQASAPSRSWLAQKLPPFTSEQYWAVRAMRAEALLAARVEHHRELKSVVFSADVRRTREVSALQQVHDARQRRLEYIVILSLACMAVLLAGVLVHLSWSGAPSTPPPSPPKRFASHFTIPILSPFTSVIEREISAVGARVIVACFVLLAGPAMYFLLRHWRIV